MRKVTIVDKPLKPGEEQITSGNVCGQCLYNMPQGTFMMLISGSMCLVIGVILFFTDSGDTWRNGMIKADIIFIALGTVLLVSGSVYFSTQWCRVRKRVPKDCEQFSSLGNSASHTSSVQLIGVYKIAGSDYPDPEDVPSKYCVGSDSETNT